MVGRKGFRRTEDVERKKAKSATSGDDAVEVPDGRETCFERIGSRSEIESYIYTCELL